MSDLLERVGQAVQQRKLLANDQSVLVAVSGGLDSMVLLNVLHELAPAHRWKLTVAHLNHQLRGRSSDADERLVRKTAERLSLPCSVERADVKRFANEKQISIEMAARELRHTFLAGTATRLGIKTVALAHHADDQVELFFLRLLRGSGSEGLAGMKWSSASPANSKIMICRPLLDEAKAAISDYAHQKKIHFREDASNRSLDFQRNWIRHKLLPLLERKFGASASSNILRSMKIIGEEGSIVAEISKRWLRQKKPAFKSLPVAVQRDCIKSQLLACGVPPDFDLIEQLRTRPGKPVSIAPDTFVCLSLDGNLRIERMVARQFKSNSCELRISGAAGRCTFGDLKISMRISARKHGLSPKSAAGQETFDADKVGRKIVLRHWRPGDRFQPIGSPFAVKLQNFFTNEKIPAQRRRGLVLATTSAGEIFWVENMRIGENFKVTPQTERCLVWQWTASRSIK